MKGFVSDISGAAQQIAIHHFISKRWLSFNPLAFVLVLSCQSSHSNSAALCPRRRLDANKVFTLTIECSGSSCIPRRKGIQRKASSKVPNSLHIHISLHFPCLLGMSLRCAKPKRWAICAAICLITYFEVTSTISLLSFQNSDRIQRKTLPQYK